MAQLSYTPEELKQIIGKKLTEASKAHAEEMAKAKVQAKEAAKEAAKAAKAEREVFEQRASCNNPYGRT